MVGKNYETKEGFFYSFSINASNFPCFSFHFFPFFPFERESYHPYFHKKKKKTDKMKDTIIK